MEKTSKNNISTVQNQTETNDLRELIIKIENILIPLFDYLNENDTIIQLSGKLWNNIFTILNTLNNFKISILDSLGIPKSVDIWKTIYEIEKINQILYLTKLQNNNKNIKSKKIAVSKEENL